MSQRTMLIATFMVMVFGSTSATALLLSTAPAWNGWVRSDRMTEVTIRVVGERGGLLTLTLTDQSTSYTHKTNLEPNIEFIWRVPVSPPSTLPLLLRAQLNEEPVIEQEITFRRHLAPTPLVAILTHQPILLEETHATTIQITGDSLPFNNSSFAAMDLILIHQDSLKGLARQQLIALWQYAARCGRIVIVGLAPTALARFTSLAGCGGQFIVAPQTMADLDTHIARLLKRPVPQLPSAGSLQSLLDNNAMVRQTLSLVTFFMIYLVILMIAVKSHRAPVYFVSASTLATLIGLVAWTMSSETIDRVVWTEMENRADLARFTSIMRVLGSGERVSVDVPFNAGPLRALQPMKLVIEVGQNGDANTNVSFDTRPLSQHEFVTSGVTTVPPPLIVEYSGDVPSITNNSGGESPPAILAWNDLKYSVPTLKQGQDWHPSSRPEPWGTSRAERLFRQRAMGESTALLFEFPPGNQQAVNATYTYLMVRS